MITTSSKVPPAAIPIAPPGASKKPPKKNAALHSSASEDFGTPSAYIEVASEVMGGIDFDPASSSYWNHWTVKARTFYDERIDALKPENAWFGKTWLNAPSNRERGISVTPFWRRLVDEYANGRVECAFWMGFTLEQLTQLQDCPMHPLQFLNWFPASRIAFLQRTRGNGPPVEATSPTHGNFLCFLPSRRSPSVAREQVRRFVELTGRLQIGGAIVRPVV